MTLALIAGAGELPALIAERQERPPVVAALAGFAPDGLTPDITFRIEHLGSTLAELKSRGITQICMVGRVARPAVDPTAIDAATRPLIPKLMAAMAQGDDGALRGLIAVIEGAGFAVLGAHSLAGDLLPAPGVLAGTLTDGAQADAARGAQIVTAMGAADIGQACVVARGQALAVEALPGTDWMLRSLLVSGGPAPSDLSDPLGMVSDWLSGPAAPQTKPTRDPALPPGGILYKAPKPGQELRVDMPTIGPDTLARAAEAGLDGVVVAAGGVLVLNAPRCAEIAERHGMLLWVRP
ncbi:MAG: UDP-2,3-diacylglucosamine diphosphatase LpxI [Pseudomonadota bacterium]